MAEWFKRGTVNTFYRGSNPLKASNYKTNMLKLVNNLLLSRSGSDSLRVRVSLFVIFGFKDSVNLRRDSVKVAQ